MDKINFMDKIKKWSLVNCANSWMRGYVSGVSRVSQVGSEIFGAGLWFEVDPKSGVGLKFHMGQNVHTLPWIIFRVFID